MPSTTEGFHSGELLVQHRAGVADDAARLEGMLGEADIDARTGAWLARRTFAAFTARDAAGRLWTIPLAGEPGFLRGAGTTLAVAAGPAGFGPLASLTVGSPAALIVIDFPSRRRFRINGAVVAITAEGLRIEAVETFGNCPAYIPGREVVAAARPAAARPAQPGLNAYGRAIVENVDSFFLGTAHPTRPADTSHKGGRPGFVRVEEDGSIWWPDYSGNNMFNSLGNLAENPEASALFVDYDHGVALHLSGTAVLEWIEPGVVGDDDGTGRRVRFRIEQAVLAPAALRAVTEPNPSPANPLLREQ
ncbi:MAG: pyridoxamine 5'-phosphate oxidase family protein [Sporichthyaceae bacterium]